MPSKSSRAGYRTLGGLLAGGVLLVCAAALFYASYPLIHIHNAPARYDRRAEHLSANITGEISVFAPSVHYRLNGGPSKRLWQRAPRTPKPLFTLELLRDELVAGANEVVIEAGLPFLPGQTESVRFEYDPSPIEPPVTVEWSGRDLEAQDGRWEAFQQGSEWRVRPSPGFEGFDRILMVVGAFPGGRRVKTDVVYRHRTGNTEHGYGVLSMWGGHPGPADFRPRRGWIFSLAWYWDRPNGVGNELSYRFGQTAPVWVNSYFNLSPEPGVPYDIEVECFPEVDPAGRHLRYRQRMRWWRRGDSPPAVWIEMTDDSGAPLPAGEYSVALLAYNSQVDFGAVRVEPMPARVVPAPGR